MPFRAFHPRLLLVGLGLCFAPALASTATGPEFELASCSATCALTTEAVELRDVLQELLDRARQLEATDGLAEAMDAWNRSAALMTAGPERDRSVASALALQARLTLRRELQETFPTDKVVFEELGIRGVDAAGLLIRTTQTAWRGVPLDLLSRASACARASRQARQGLVHEMLARGSEVEKRRALEMLAKMLERSEIEPADAWQAVARARSETMPSGGYVWRESAWHSLAVLAEAAQTSGLEALGRCLELATAAERDAALAAVEALGPEGRARLESALKVRWEAAFEALRKAPTFGRLAGIAKARREVDVKRQHALELIFDEVRYFYPYAPPACPTWKAREYPAVQHAVDERVTALRAAWDVPKRVSVPAGFREALREIGWNREQHRTRRLACALPEGFEDWIFALDPEQGEVDVHTWAWDAKERTARDRETEIQALNERRMPVKPADPAASMAADEIRQVEMTNSYRRMFGRTVLAWNPKLQSAAQGHSDSMSLTGEFGHDEKDPKRRTPRDRMKLVGYLAGAGENCHMGGGAESAHQGWIHSSGHHRNLLAESHREMGSAAAGPYWTQNFGSGREFEALLEAPRTGASARSKADGQRTNAR